MNLIEAFKAGQLGRNKGLPTGIDAIDRDVYGIQRKAVYTVAAPPKAGKTALVDFLFVLMPYLLAPLSKVHIIYFSFEIDRIKKEFKFAAFFFYYDYNIDTFEYRGRQYKMSAEYLLGKYIDHEKKPIPVCEEHKNMLKTIYVKHIIPLFGEYDQNGKKLKNGRITFVEERENPTGLRNYILRHADTHGKFIHETYEVRGVTGTETRTRITGYKPNDPEEMLIIVTDHIRKLKKERNFNTKDNIDKWVEYQVELRNWCAYTFVNIIHLNRNLATPERLKNNIEFLYPTGDDVKDSGNLSEDSDFILTMFNPNEEKYGITRHFGTPLVGPHEENLYPRYRSLHLVESRDTEAPLHFKLDFRGNVGHFSQFQEDAIGYGFHQT